MEQLLNLRKNMKYNPGLPDDGVNVTKGKPLKEFFKMFIGLIVILLAFYIILGFSISLIAPYIPQSVENGMGSLFKNSFCMDENKEESKKLQAILDKLTATPA